MTFKDFKQHVHMITQVFFSPTSQNIGCLVLIFCLDSKKLILKNYPQIKSMYNFYLIFNSFKFD
jgi:hypothetical protein